MSNKNKQNVTKKLNALEKELSKEEKQIKKESLWTKFMIFCNGVKEEFKKINWPNKDNMVKYSVATIVFIIFFSVFFYFIDILFALIQTLFN